MLSERAMDADEFRRRTAPAGRSRSAMGQYLADLLALRQDGYTLAQLREFLQLNGVEVSTQALSAYLSRHSPGAANSAPAPEPAPTPASPATGGPLDNKRAERERRASQWVSDTTTNPLLDRLEHKEK